MEVETLATRLIGQTDHAMPGDVINPLTRHFLCARSSGYEQGRQQDKQNNVNRKVTTNHDDLLVVGVISQTRSERTPGKHGLPNTRQSRDIDESSIEKN